MLPLSLLSLLGDLRSSSKEQAERVTAILHPEELDEEGEDDDEETEPEVDADALFGGRGLGGDKDG
jgi:hypothetical protein